MKLNIRQKLLLALAALLIVTAGLQQLYNRQALISAANEGVERFETSVAEVQINGLKTGWTPAPPSSVVPRKDFLPPKTQKRRLLRPHRAVNLT